jgi:glycosyltransferase involved in cell wall biosynthesis
MNQFWSKHWEDRLVPDGGVMMNKGKANKILSHLAGRNDLAGMSKLDIGCGTGIHVQILSNTNPAWKERYLGVDLSESAIKFAVEAGLGAVCMDVVRLPDLPEPIELFLLLDTLEHIEDLTAVAWKIRRLGSRSGFTVFGNVPLYLSDHSKEGGFERPVDIEVVTKFLKQCGIHDFKHEVYDVNGFQYMMFEGKSGGKSASTMKTTVEFINPYPMNWRGCFDHAFSECKTKWLEHLDPSTCPDHRFFMWCAEDALKATTNGTSLRSLHHGTANSVFIRRFEYYSDMIERVDWSKVRNIFCVNDHLAAGIEKRTGRMPHVVYNGVLLDGWRFRKGRPGNNIAMVGFINSRKNFPLAMEIMNLLQRDYVLHIAGQAQSPDVLDYMREYCDANNIQCRMYGQVKDMDGWLEDKDYLLCTSISEGCPNNVIEAMAKGIKPVVHCWPGAREQFGPYVFKTAYEAVNMIAEQVYDSPAYNQVVMEKFSLKNYMRIREILLGEAS